MVKVLFLCPSIMQQFRISNEKMRPRGNRYVSLHVWTSPTVPHIHAWPSTRPFLIVCSISTAFYSVTHVHETWRRGALQRDEHAMHRHAEYTLRVWMRTMRCDATNQNALIIIKQALFIITDAFWFDASLVCRVQSLKRPFLYKEPRTISSYHNVHNVEAIFGTTEVM